MRTRLLILLAMATPAWAAGISVYPTSVHLLGADAQQVLTVSAAERDVTANCSFQLENTDVASVSEEGVLTATANGKTELAVECEQGNVEIPVSVASAGEKPKLSFVKDVVPIFTMGGCAGSSCHGSIRGQNGFKLSLFGYEPDLDYEAIQSRIDLKNPEQSLLLQKPTFQVAHGGGVRFPVDSLNYRTILEWIRSGAEYDSGDAPRIESLTVYPEERILSGAGATQQLVATATYTDGTSRDVTHFVQYSSNNPDVIQASTDGKIQALQPGETAVMVRTLGQAVAAKFYVPQPEELRTSEASRSLRNNYIDEHVFSKLERLHISPSRLTTDEEFLRRIYLDTIGLLPSEAEATGFLNATGADKRAKLIDHLLERPEFSELWALKFTEMFRAGTHEAGSKGARLVYQYLKESFLDNKPYDQLVTELLVSQGAHLFDFGNIAPASFYNISRHSEAEDHATNISQLFLGVRIECARCHNHPWEKWTQDDFYGFAAFFARMAKKEVYQNDENGHYWAPEPVDFVLKPRPVKNPVTEAVAVPKYLDGGHEPDLPEKDVREDLARWMTDARNPFFSRAIVNRIWKQYLGRGLVEEVDDFRVTNPPVNPGLLDAMAEVLSSHNYDLRHLIRAILNSRTYQLSAEPNNSNRGDQINHSRYYMRRLLAEEILDTIVQITGISEKYDGYPPGTRAMQVYSGTPHYVLQTFGRLNRETICERDSQPEITQVLHLISGDTINKKVAKWEPDSTLDDEQQLNRIFLTSLSRYPRQPEREAIAAKLANHDRRQVFQDLLWAILNSKEYLYNH